MPAMHEQRGVRPLAGVGKAERVEDGCCARAARAKRERPGPRRRGNGGDRAEPGRHADRERGQRKRAVVRILEDLEAALDRHAGEERVGDVQKSVQMDGPAQRDARGERDDDR